MNIAIAGRARVGKDTVGEYLVKSRGYRRVAFADALKEAALRADPVVANFPDEITQLPVDVRLSEVVHAIGWEEAKDHTPEVRRFLQELGAAMRAVDPEIWIRAALKKVDEANAQGVPCVITDVRYLNELDTLRRLRWHTVHISRPGAPRLIHESEGAITPSDTEFRLVNDGTLESLHRCVDALLVDVDAIESARHYARSL